MRIENQNIFKKIKQLSNAKKFKIIELTQSEELDIGLLSKKIELAFNKCSNYCTELQKSGLVEKYKEGKNVLIRSKVSLLGSSIAFK